MLAVLSFCSNISIIHAHSTSQDSQNLEIYQDIGGNFTLLSSNNQNISLNDFQGKVVLLFFGFTACPDTCPITLSKLQQVMAKLDPQKPVQQLFITVDPKRDNPEQLKYFLFIPSSYSELFKCYNIIENLRSRFLYQMSASNCLMPSIICIPSVS